MNDILSKEIDEEEIRRSIWALQPDKAPDRMAFPSIFIGAFWGIIKKDLIKMLKWIQRKGKIGGYTNATHLALIPKENRPFLCRFQAHILCNSSYKILTKIIATRLKAFLPSLFLKIKGDS